MTFRASVCLTALILAGSLEAAAHPAPGHEGGQGDAGLPAPVPQGGDVRRPHGVPPGSGNGGGGQGPNAPAPTPRALTAGELDELRKRMVSGSRGTILKPDEITGVRRSVQEAQGAGNFPGRDGKLPRPEPRVVEVSREASTNRPETLFLAYGVVSPITFVDGKGNPWPIASVAYDPRLFAQDGTGCGTDNGMGPQSVAAGAGSDRPTSINLMPCRFDTWGNILIRLENVAYPVPFMVLSGSNERVDIPITVRVAGTSPLQPVRVASTAPAPRGRPAPRGAPAAPDTTRLLHLFAAGTPPPGAQTLNASSGAQAWIYRERMYVRAQGELVSPQPVGSAVGPNGVKVYEFSRPASRLVAERGDGAEVAISVDF